MLSYRLPLLVLSLLIALGQLCTPLDSRAQNEVRDILILHSYHPDLGWTAGINAAMQKQLRAERPGLSIHVEYLDTKRNQSAWYRDAYLEGVLVRKLNGDRYKVVLTSDNDAFNFALRHRGDLFLATPIVFCGVNGYTPAMLGGQTGITGIAEVPAFRETINLALNLHPGSDRLVIIGETVTETGRKNDESLHQVAGELNPSALVEFWNDLPLETLQEKVAGLGKGEIVFLASTLIEHGRVLDFAESARRLRSVCKMPIYGFWDFFLGNGIVGGRLTNSEKQGRLAAQVALRIMRGTDADTIPVTSAAANRYMFDNNELERFDIPLAELPAESVVINLPNRFYKLDHWQFWAGVAFIGLLGLIIFLLLHIIANRRRNEKEAAERSRLDSLTAEIGRFLTRDASMQQILQNCCEALVTQTGAAFGRIWVTDEHDPELLELLASAGLFTRIEKSRHRFKRFGELKVGLIASERRPILTNKVAGDPMFTDQDWIARDGIVGFAGYPLIVNDRVVGVIAFFSKHPLTQRVQHLVASVADMIAVGVERYRTAKALQQAVLQAESARDNIDAILRSVADGLIVTDLAQNIVLVNEAAEQMLDIDFDDVCCKPLSVMTQGRTYAEQLQRVMQNSGTEIEITLPAGSGNEQRVIQIRTAQVLRHDRSVGGIVAVLRDITRQRELDRMKSEFIAVAAHELRTPLATIQGYAEILQNPEFNERLSAEQQQEYLGYILDRSEALERIINDLLDIGREETGRTMLLERAPCEMISLVHEIVNHHRRESPEHTFITDCPEACLKLSIDRNMMHRVFDNLLSNAVKYSPGGGVVRIGGRMEDNYLVVTISDQGIGMSAEQVEQAFTKFYRADTSDTAVRGLGLGLTICKTIVEAHGGRIWLESVPYEGTVVRFALPIDQK